MPHYTTYAPSLDVRPKHGLPGTTFDSSIFHSHTTEDSPITHINTVPPLHTHSPGPSHSTLSTSSRDSGSEPLVDEKDSPSVSQRSESTGAKDEKEKVEKRKRSRVTPEQLVHLERFFLLDRSPTAARRKEISELLGMQERQTQIWFQNRRAKAKLQDGKHKGRGASIEVPPSSSPPKLSTGLRVDLHSLVHEDEPVTIIPCTDLTIGSWRRIATSQTKHDLVAYVCDSKRCLTWFIHSVGFGFKMEIPFDFIIDAEFTNASAGSGLASFILSEPPLFYLENLGPPSANGIAVRHWKRCSDWTEGQQASRVLRHDLIGSSVQLSHLIRNLQNATPPNLPHRTSSNSSDQPTSPVELPDPPLANLTGPGYHYHQPQPIEYQPSLFQKTSPYVGQSLTSPSPESPYSNDGDRPPAFNTAVPVSFGQHQPHYSINHASRPPSASYGVEGGSVYTHYSPVDAHHGPPPRSQPTEGYSDIANSHNVLPRPYSAQSVPRSYYDSHPRSMQPYPHEDMINMRRESVASTEASGIHPSSISHLLRPQPYPSPSPPLLTTSFNPLLDQNRNA